jgi:putative salt-induced outer membrane protein YdiY
LREITSFRQAKVAALALVATQIVHADDMVVMKNGDRITGDVKQVWNGEVFIEPEYGDEYAIDLDYVAYVQTEEPFEVEVRIGRRIEMVIGRLGQSETGEASVLGEDGSVLYPLSMVDNVEEIEDYFDWEVRTDASVNVSEGNTEASSSYLTFYAQLKVGDHRHEFTVSRDEQRTNNELTKDQTQAIYQDTWTFTPKWFVRGTVSWTRDPIRDLDMRSRLFVGPGYHIFEDSKRRMNVSIGPEYVSEKIGDESEQSAAIKATYDYEQKFLQDDLVVFANFDYTRIYDGRQNKLLETRLGIRYDVTDDIYLTMQGTYDYESNPASDQKNEDITYLMGVGVTVD